MLAFASHPHRAVRSSRSALGAPLLDERRRAPRWSASRRCASASSAITAATPQPEAVVRGALTDFETAGENIVGAQQIDLELAPGETQELIVMLGLGTPESHGVAAVARVRRPPSAAQRELERVKESWHALLGSTCA